MRSTVFFPFPPAPEPTACDVYKQAATCQRIALCVRYRCTFGAVDKP
jgi:hypothetical protein